MTSDALSPHNQAGPPHNLAISHASAAAASTASPPSKRDLKSWWKGFKLPSKHQETHGHEQAEFRMTGIFGVPLRQSITYANVAISLIDENGQSYIYGYVPIVVAKCGVFLKEKATGVEGIFRLSGSEKRIKELKTIFDSPDRYGKGLVWDGYTVHDAANVLRRYLNDLPEPVVPLDLYEKFRDPLRGATKQTAGDAEGPQFIDNFDIADAIIKYQKLITELPPLNRQLLLYILDLLAVFAAKADENRMNSQNLAAIFQPGMLSHPNHAMAPDEYRLNQCVIIFLIENQDNFLIGMLGTATDEKTVKEIESGQHHQQQQHQQQQQPDQPVVALPTTPLSITKNSSLGRSASNASAGAESVRRDGKIRRNRSTSSRHSRHSRHGHDAPTSPASITTPTSGGLTRSNTVPSKKSPHLQAGRFQRERVPSPMVHTPVLDGLPAATAEIGPAETSPTPSSIPPAAGATALVPGPYVGPGRSQERLLEPHDATTPIKDRKLPAFFSRSPTAAGDGEPRQPNKLKKKRIPDNLPSAASSTISLTQSIVLSPKLEATSLADKGDVPTFGASDYLHPGATGVIQSGSDVSSELTLKASQMPSTNNNNNNNNNSLPAHPEARKGQKSPPGSIHSSSNEGSDLDQTDDQVPQLPGQPEKEKRRRWRLSRPTKKEEGSPTPGLTSPRLGLGSNNNAEISTLSIGSGSRPRKSFTGDSSDLNALGLEMIESKDRDDSKGPIGWIRNKYREAKESVEQKRNKSPPADQRHPARESLDAISDEGRSLAQSTTSPVPAQGSFPSNPPQSPSQSQQQA